MRAVDSIDSEPPADISAEMGRLKHLLAAGRAAHKKLTRMIRAVKINGAVVTIPGVRPLCFPKSTIVRELLGSLLPVDAV